MSSFAGSITALFVAGMVGGYAGLCLLGPTDETQTTAVAAAHHPRSAGGAVQHAGLAERGSQVSRLDRAACGSGGATRQTDGAQKAVASAPSPDKRATGGAAFDGRHERRGDAAGCGSCSGCASRAGRPGRGAREGGRSQVAHGGPCQQTKALAVMRGFGDNLNDVRLNAYASDGSSRRSATRSAQDRSFFGTRSGGWWW